VIPKDKLHHIVYSFALVVAGAVFMPVGWAALIAVVIGALKEWYWDGIMRRGMPEWADFVADLIGVALACIVVGRWVG